MAWILIGGLVAASGACHLAGGPALATFLLAAGGLVAIGTVLSQACEEVSARLGPAPGAFLNATFGNAPELVISLIALGHGLVDVVKAAITGSILANLLLVVGLGATVGGVRHKLMDLNPAAVSNNLGTLTLAVVGILTPAVFTRVPHPQAHYPLQERVEELSLGVAAVLLVLYLLGLVFATRTHRDILGGHHGEDRAPAWSLRRGVATLAVLAGLIVVQSELLVQALESLMQGSGLSPIFMGVVAVAAVGNAADYTVGIQLAWRNRMDLTFQLACGAATQVALFMAPLLVLLSRALGSPMNLDFSPLEVLAVVMAGVVVSVHALDNRFTWFEGVQLLGVYGILAATFYFY